jgi:hypothetical protein
LAKEDTKNTKTKKKNKKQNKTKQMKVKNGIMLLKKPKKGQKNPILKKRL